MLLLLLLLFLNSLTIILSNSNDYWIGTNETLNIAGLLGLHRGAIPAIELALKEINSSRSNLTKYEMRFIWNLTSV